MQRPRPRRLPEARPQHDRVDHGQQLIEVAGTRDAVADDLRSAVQHGRHIVGMRRHVNEPRAHAQRRLGGEPDGTRHSGTATDQQQAPVGPLVRRAGAPRENAVEIRCRQPNEPRSHAGSERWRHIERRQLERTEVVDRGAEEQPLFQSDERHRRRCVHRGPSWRTRVGVYAARHIQSQNRPLRGIHGLDRIQKCAGYRPIGADPQHAVHDHVRAIEPDR